jgi:hypothetical protein
MSTTVVFPLLPMVNTVAQFSEDHELILHRLSANFFIARMSGISRPTHHGLYKGRAPLLPPFITSIHTYISPHH